MSNSLLSSPLLSSLIRRVSAEVETELNWSITITQNSNVIPDKAGVFATICETISIQFVGGMNLNRLDDIHID